MCANEPLGDTGRQSFAMTIASSADARLSAGRNHDRVVEQQNFDGALQQIDEVVVAADVGELVSEQRLSASRAQVDSSGM